MEIRKLVKPTVEEINEIEILENYYVLQDEDDDGYKLIAAPKGDFAFHNIANEDIFQEKILFQKVMNYPKLFSFAGFTEEEICQGISLSRYLYDYAVYVSKDGVRKEVSTSEIERFYDKVEVPSLITKCKVLYPPDYYSGFDSKEFYKRIRKLIPSFDSYCYFKVDNEMLSKVEVPFLIFDRNKGKCFIWVED